MKALSNQSGAFSAGVAQQSHCHCPYLPGKVAAAAIQPVSLSFTYSPKSESLIKAVKLTERTPALCDVLTLYYPPGSILFTGSSCQESLSYKRKDMIFKGDPEHEARLHRSEDPIYQSDDRRGWHCHIKVEHENIRPFVKKLFERHKLDTNASHTHEAQFTHSMDVFRAKPESKGLIFPDGSYSHNGECDDMLKSKIVDQSAFQFAGNGAGLMVCPDLPGG